MSKQGYRYCKPNKRKKKRNAGNSKIGVMMLSLGAVTVMILLLPLKCWVIVLSLVLVVCGLFLIKK